MSDPLTVPHLRQAIALWLTTGQLAFGVPPVSAQPPCSTLRPTTENKVESGLEEALASGRRTAGLEEIPKSEPSVGREPFSEERFRQELSGKTERNEAGRYLSRKIRVKSTDPRPMLARWHADSEAWGGLLKGQRQEIMRWLSRNTQGAPFLWEVFRDQIGRREDWVGTRTSALRGMARMAASEQAREEVLNLAKILRGQLLEKEPIERQEGLHTDLAEMVNDLDYNPATQWFLGLPKPPGTGLEEPAQAGPMEELVAWDWKEAIIPRLYPGQRYVGLVRLPPFTWLRIPRYAFPVGSPVKISLGESSIYLAQWEPGQFRISRQPGPASGEGVRLEKDIPLLVGRGGGYSPKKKDRVISRKHVVITLESGAILLRDVSRFGTYLTPEEVKILLSNLFEQTARQLQASQAVVTVIDEQGRRINGKISIVSPPTLTLSRSDDTSTELRLDQLRFIGSPEQADKVQKPAAGLEEALASGSEEMSLEAFFAGFGHTNASDLTRWLWEQIRAGKDWIPPFLQMANDDEDWESLDNWEKRTVLNLIGAESHRWKGKPYEDDLRNVLKREAAVPSEGLGDPSIPISAARALAGLSTTPEQREEAVEAAIRILEVLLKSDRITGLAPFDRLRLALALATAQTQPSIGVLDWLIRRGYFTSRVSDVETGWIDPGKGERYIRFTLKRSVRGTAGEVAKPEPEHWMIRSQDPSHRDQGRWSEQMPSDRGLWGPLALDPRALEEFTRHSREWKEVAFFLPPDNALRRAVEQSSAELTQGQIPGGRLDQLPPTEEVRRLETILGQKRKPSGWREMSPEEQLRRELPLKRRRHEIGGYLTEKLREKSFREKSLREITPDPRGLLVSWYAQREHWEHLLSKSQRQEVMRWLSRNTDRAPVDLWDVFRDQIGRWDDWAGTRTLALRGMAHMAATEEGKIIVLELAQKLWEQLLKKEPLERQPDIYEDFGEMAEILNYEPAWQWLLRLPKPPGTGLEEEFQDRSVRYERQAGGDPAQELISMEPLGLGDWLEPLTPQEAVALKAFVRQNPNFLPSDPAQAFQGELGETEAATFLNYLYDLSKLQEQFRPYAVQAAARVMFREGLTLGVTSLEEQWKRVFEALLEKGLRKRRADTPAVGLWRIGETLYRRVLPGGMLDIPVTQLQWGQRISFGNAARLLSELWEDAGWTIAELDDEPLLDSLLWGNEVVFIGRQQVVGETSIGIDDPSVSTRHAVLALLVSGGIFGPSVPVLRLADGYTVEKGGILTRLEARSRYGTYVESPVDGLERIRKPTPKPPGTGLEESQVDDTLVVLAEAAQGTGVLVIGPESVESRPALEELVERAPEELARRMVFFAVGPPMAERLKELNPEVPVIEGADVADLIPVLLAIPADWVTVVGLGSLVESLKRGMPSSIPVIPMDPGTDFQRFFAVLGVPEAVLQQLDMTGLEEQLTRLRAA